MKNLIAIVFGMFPHFGFAQIVVEKIKTSKDVLNFLEVNYFKGNKKDTTVYFKPGIDSISSFNINPLVLKYVDSINAPSWIKKDFNKDGKQDLIFCGFFNDRSKVFAFVSDTKAGYRIIKLSNQYDEGSIHFVYPVKNKNLFVLGRIDSEFYEWDTAFRVRTDTVQYLSKNERFGDYPFFEKPMYSIDTIKYKFLSFKKFGQYEFWISSDGNAGKTRIWLIEDTIERVGKYIYGKKISTDSVKIMFDYTSQLALEKYRKEYYPVSTGWLDGFSVIIEFKNVEGFSKEIFDRFQTAPLGIQYLYDIIFDLMKSTDWKLLEIKEKW